VSPGYRAGCKRHGTGASANKTIRNLAAEGGKEMPALGEKLGVKILATYVAMTNHQVFVAVEADDANAVSGRSVAYRPLTLPRTERVIRPLPNRTTSSRSTRRTSRRTSDCCRLKRRSVATSVCYVAGSLLLSCPHCSQAVPQKDSAGNGYESAKKGFMPLTRHEHNEHTHAHTQPEAASPSALPETEGTCWSRPVV
jgi:uncharacterized protein with GYD domain